MMGPREYVWLSVYCAAVQNPVGYSSSEAERKADDALRAYDRKFGVYAAHAMGKSEAGR